MKAPTALEYFESLVADDAHFPLLEAAVSVAQDDHPTLDLQGVLGEVDAMGAQLKRRMPKDAPALQRLRALNHFFFVSMGFSGNVNNYYDVGNSYIHRVLETRRGIPITLALLYMEWAQQIGLEARGVSFPGHFLVKLRLAEGEAVIDPFSGRSLSREDLEERLQPYRRRQGLLDDQETPLGLFLQAAPARDVMSRLLRNLKEIHLTQEDWPRLLAVQERLVRLVPQAWEERRDRGLTRSELSYIEGAIEDLEVYVAKCPKADDAASLSERLDELRSRRASRLH